MMTSNCVLAMSRRQSYVVTLAWMGMQCGGTCRAAILLRAQWLRHLTSCDASLRMTLS